MSVYQIQVNIYMFGTENLNILNGFPTFSVHKKEYSPQFYTTLLLQVAEFWRKKMWLW